MAATGGRGLTGNSLFEVFRLAGGGTGAARIRGGTGEFDCTDGATSWVGGTSAGWGMGGGGSAGGEGGGSAAGTSGASGAGEDVAEA